MKIVSPECQEAFRVLLFEKKQYAEIKPEILLQELDFFKKESYSKGEKIWCRKLIVKVVRKIGEKRE